MEQKQVALRSETPLFPVEQIERMAVAFAKSGLFGIKTPEQGVALMLIAQAEGLHPAVAARDYHIIQGRPALKADAMLARFQAAGGKVDWKAYTDQEVTGTFSHPQGGSATVSWTIAQAKSAGLTGKDVWKQYPRAMLRSRVISEGIRTVYPGVSVGVYTVEEVEDFGAKPAPQEVVAETVAPLKVESAGEIKTENLPRFDRKAAFGKLSKCGWAKDDLGHYAWSRWGKGSAKDLTDEELEAFVSIASTTQYLVAMAEIEPAAEHDVP